MEKVRVSSRVMARDFVSIGWLVSEVIFGKLWLKIFPIRFVGKKKGALTPVVIRDAKCLAAFA